jgi:hypothetical protein
MDQLATKESVSVNDLEVIAEKLQSYVGTQDDAILEEVTEALNKRPSLLTRLLPSPLEKERSRITVQSMRLLYDNKERFFKFYWDIKLEVAKRFANALISSVGMDLQTKLAKFAHDRIDELTEAVALNRTSFLGRMRPQLESLEQYRNFPELFEPAHSSMVKEIGIYFASISALLQGFIDNLTNKASQA